MTDLKREFEERGFVAVRGVFTQADAATFKQECRRILERNTAHAGVFVGLAANSGLFLLERGARMDIFAATLGRLEVIQAILRKFKEPTVVLGNAEAQECASA